MLTAMRWLLLALCVTACGGKADGSTLAMTGGNLTALATLQILQYLGSRPLHRRVSGRGLHSGPLVCEMRTLALGFVG